MGDLKPAQFGPKPARFSMGDLKPALNENVGFRYTDKRGGISTSFPGIGGISQVEEYERVGKSVISYRYIIFLFKRAFNWNI